MLSEINEIPARAEEFLTHSPSYHLPEGQFYLGMGSSYFAPLAFKFMGVNIYPELASEFYNYLYAGTRIPAGVLLSQSGRSTEVLWCLNLFEQYIAISNYPDSPLCIADEAVGVVPLMAGDELASSSKTYINTLLALFKGFGMDMKKAVRIMKTKMDKYEAAGKSMALAVYDILQIAASTNLYITGSGPNIATALQAALILTESTKLNFNGLPLAQYDHGPKETAKNSIVIHIKAKGKCYDRTERLGRTIAAAGAQLFTVEEPEATEKASVLHNIIPFNFMAYYLAQHLHIKDTFLVGGKVTEIDLAG